MHDRRGEYRKAIESMEKAVAIDPEFASAYHVMSWCYGNLGYLAEEKKYIQKALDLSNRLSDKEKYNIQGGFYLDSEETYDKALQALNKLTDLYPDDIQGNNLLGNLYSRLSQREKAIEYYGKAIRAGTEDVVIYTNQAGCYKALGLYDRALEVCKDYIENISDSAAIRRYLALIYRDKGNYEQALVEADKAITLSGDFWKNIRTKGDIYLYMDEFDKAEQEYRRLLEKQETVAYVWGMSRLNGLCLLQGKFSESKKKVQQIMDISKKLSQPSWTLRSHYSLSYSLLRMGHHEQALEELSQAWQVAEKEGDISFQRYILLDQVLVYLEMNSIKEAEKKATQLKQMVDQAPNEKLVYIHHYVTGMIELEKKNVDKAVEWIQKARSLLDSNDDSNMLYTHSLGKAFYLSGDLEKAAHEFENAAALNTGKLSFGDVYVRSYFMLGQVYQDMGQNDKAIKNYQKFLNLWKDAGPDVTEIKKARTQLQKLQPL
jgi:tetratricopeptide (TPR) repeat protein